jgi:hypothetical protein
MAMLITSIASIKAQTTEEGFKLFCQEAGINPANYVEPEEGVCVDKMDLYRYGAGTVAQALAESVAAFQKDSMRP